METTNQQAKALYSFDVQQQGDTTLFTYKKLPYTASIIFFGIITFAALGILPGILFGSGWVWAFITFILPFILFFVINAQRKKGGSFSISEQHIHVDGVDYNRTHVSDLFIKVPYADEQVTHIERHYIGRTAFVRNDAPSMVGYGATMAVTKGVGTAVGAAQMATSGAANQIKKQYIKKNVQIGFLFGEKKITLANGLTADSAGVLYRKVIEVLEAA